jgi:hypothetical protein
VKARAGVPCLLLVSLAAVPVVHATESSAVDADFLEFLGSVDSRDEGWHEYLANADLEKVARTPVKPPAIKPPEKEPEKGSGK